MSERRFISWAAMFHLLGKVSLAIHRERDCYCSGIRKLYSIGTKSPTTYATYSPRVACMDREGTYCFFKETLNRWNSVFSTSGIPAGYYAL